MADNFVLVAYHPSPMTPYPVHVTQRAELYQILGTAPHLIKDKDAKDPENIRG
jgi:hypothetical protein